MELSDIKASLSELSDEQLMVLLKDIRSNRRVSKAKPESTRTRTARIAKPKASKEVSFDALLNGLSADQIALLMKKMEG